VCEQSVARTILSCLGLGLAAIAATGAVAGLSGYASPEAVAAGAALGGMAGNFATDLCKVLHRPVAERWLEGRRGSTTTTTLPASFVWPNWLACGPFSGGSTWCGLRSGGCARRQEAERFSQALKQFLEAETTAAKRAGFNATSDLAADERRIRDEVLSGLPDVFDESLAARRARGENAALAEGHPA
jgi:hypothetical protein